MIEPSPISFSNYAFSEYHLYEYTLSNAFISSCGQSSCGFYVLANKGFDLVSQGIRSSISTSLSLPINLTLTQYLPLAETTGAPFYWG